MTDTKSHTQESQKTPREMNTKETNEQITFRGTAQQTPENKRQGNPH